MCRSVIVMNFAGHKFRATPAPVLTQQERNNRFWTHENSRLNNVLRPKFLNVANIIMQNSFATKCFRTGQARNRAQNGLAPKSSCSRVYQIKRGYALVIHNKNFNYNLRPREGSEKDLEVIKDFCEEADLNLDIIQDVTIDEIRAHCLKLVTKERSVFQNYDGFVCFILSHGNG